MPSSARMAKEKKVRLAGTPQMSLSPRNGFQLAAANEFAAAFPFASHTTPARPIRKIAAA